MIKRITLENIMSHRRSVIEPAAGLTLLTGPNNCGKSAIVLALQALCYNERGIGKHLIRHGEKNARIMVETDDGHRVEWVSENGSVRYVVDGVRTDRSVVPDDLAPKLRLPLVEGDDGKTFDIHFAEQKDPIFLLNGGSRAAAFFAASSDAGYLVKMQQLLRQRKSENNQLQRSLKLQFDAMGKELVAYEPLPEIDTLLAEVGRQHETTEASLRAAREARQLVQNLAESYEKVAHLAGEQSALKALEAPPKLADTQGLKRHCEALDALDRRVRNSCATQTALEPLAPPPELSDNEPLRGLLSQLENRTRRRREMSAFKEALGPLAEPPALIIDEPLRRVIDQLESIELGKAACYQDVVLMDQQMEAVRQELREFAASHPVCPTCGGRVNAENLLQGAHAHG